MPFGNPFSYAQPGMANLGVTNIGPQDPNSTAGSFGNFVNQPIPQAPYQPGGGQGNYGPMNPGGQVGATYRGPYAQPPQGQQAPPQGVQPVGPANRPDYGPMNPGGAVGMQLEGIAPQGHQLPFNPGIQPSGGNQLPGPMNPGGTMGAFPAPVAPNPWLSMLMNPQRTGSFSDFLARR